MPASDPVVETNNLLRAIESVLRSSLRRISYVFAATAELKKTSSALANPHLLSRTFRLVFDETCALRCTSEPRRSIACWRAPTTTGTPGSADPPGDTPAKYSSGLSILIFAPGVSMSTVSAGEKSWPGLSVKLPPTPARLVLPVVNRAYFASTVTCPTS